MKNILFAKSLSIQKYNKSRLNIVDMCVYTRTCRNTHIYICMYIYCLFIAYTHISVYTGNTQIGHSALRQPMMNSNAEAFFKCLRYIVKFKVAIHIYFSSFCSFSFVPSLLLKLFHSLFTLMLTAFRQNFVRDVTFASQGRVTSWPSQMPLPSH